jgi:hypothetical protein
MLSRCSNPNTKTYHHYGGRGISVCDKWKKFRGFYEDMGKTYKSGLTIERIDNDGNYDLNNCRWATRRVQSNNRRGLNLITHNGETLNFRQWAEKTGINPSTLYGRLNRGMTFAEAITPGNFKQSKLEELAKEGE